MDQALYTAPCSLFPVPRQLAKCRDHLFGVLAQRIPVERRPHCHVDPLRAGFDVRAELVDDLLWAAPDRASLLRVLVGLLRGHEEVEVDAALERLRIALVVL